MSFGFYSVKILLDGGRGAHLALSLHVKIQRRFSGAVRSQQRFQARCATVSRSNHRADSDGMRRAVPEDRRRAAARTERHALPQRPQPAVRRAGRTLVRRRRHAARLPPGERPRQLSQSLGPHAEMDGRARRGPRAVRRFWPQAAGCAADGDHGRRRRQHQHHLSRRPPAGAGGRPPADRDRARHAEDPRLCRLRPLDRRPLHRASEDRSRDRRDDLLRLQRGRPPHRGDVVRRGRRQRRRHPLRSLPDALCQHGARLHRHRKPRAVPDPAAHRQHGAGDERPAALRLGAGQGLVRRRDEAQRRGEGHRLVPRRGLLRLPCDECVGGRQQDHRRRDAVRGSAPLPASGRPPHRP